MRNASEIIGFAASKFDSGAHITYLLGADRDCSLVVEAVPLKQLWCTCARLSVVAITLTAVRVAVIAIAVAVAIAIIVARA